MISTDLAAFVVLATAPVLALSLLATRVARSWPLPLPSVGVFDRTDVAIIAAVVVAFPFVGSAVPVVVSSLVFASLMAMSLGDLSAASVSGWRRAALAWGTVGTVALADGAGWWWGWVILDLVLAATVVAIVGAWVQTGMHLRHVAALGGFLTAYDLVATHLTDLTGRLMEGMLDGPVAFVFRVEAGAEHFSVGFGDVLMMAALTATLFHNRPRQPAIGWTAAAFAAFVGGLAYAHARPGTPVAMMTFVGPVAVAAALVGRWGQENPPASPLVPMTEDTPRSKTRAKAVAR